MEKISVSEIQSYFKEYLDGYSDWTIKKYLYWFNKFPHTQFLEADIRKEGQDIIDTYIRKHDNNVARGFLRSYLKCFDLFRDYDIPERKRTTRKLKLKDPLTIEEVKKLSKAMRKKGHIHWLAFRLIYEGGLRRGELKSIKYDSFLWNKWFKDPSKPIVLKVRGKGNKERYVLISFNTIKRHWNYLKMKNNFSNGELIKVIKKTKNKEKNIRVCKFGEEWFYKHITRISKKVLGRNVNPHLLRHSRATYLLEKGVHIKDIQNYLGHSNLATTEIYLHRDKKKSLENIEKKLDKKKNR